VIRGYAVPRDVLLNFVAGVANRAGASSLSDASGYSNASAT
jgi:hypothetical protein